MRRAALVVALALATTVFVAPAASAQEFQGAPPPANGAPPIPFITVLIPTADDPYVELEFEANGDPIPGLLPGVLEAAAEDSSLFEILAQSLDNGFGNLESDGEALEAFGVPLVGRNAPDIEEGETINDTNRDVGLGDGAIPQLPNANTVDRTVFAFVDENGNPTVPPDEDPSSAPTLSPPSEGIDAVPPVDVPDDVPATPASNGDDEPIEVQPGPSVSTTAPTTTVTTPSRSTTTLPPTTTTTNPPTSTTVPPPTTTTTTPPPDATDFQMTQKHGSTVCVATGGQSGTCDAIWQLQLGRSGQQASFDVTLHNSGSVNADAVMVWASSQCETTSIAQPSGSGDLCSKVQIMVQRYTTAALDVPLECVYGGGTATVCSLSTSRTLADFSATYPTAATAQRMGSGMEQDASMYMRLTLRLPEVDNSFQRRAATINLSWAMQ